MPVVREYIPVKVSELQSGEWRDLLDSDLILNEDAIDGLLSDDEFRKEFFGNRRTKRDMYIIFIRAPIEIDTIEINGVQRQLCFRLRFLVPPDSKYIHIKVKHIEFTLVTEEFGKQKEYKRMEDGRLEIYIERIRMTFLVLPEDNPCDAYLSWSGERPTGDDGEWKKYHHLMYDALLLYGCKEYSYIWQDPEMSQQRIYYDNFYKVLYWIDTDLATDAITFGKYDTVNRSVIFRLFWLQPSDTIPWDFCYGYQSITEQLWITDRYHYLKNEVLYGQDNEFNIFKSLCFLPPDEEDLDQRLSIGILCLISQFLLTIGIVMEVYNNWDIDEMIDSDPMIIVISFVVFSFISYTTRWTLIKFLEFYTNATPVIKIPWWIMVLDFVSNIVIGFVICLVSFAYLLQSETHH